MTKQEIKDLIATKISGQGNQVDIGNALATVLNEVIDKMPESSPYELYTSNYTFDEFSNITNELTFIAEFGNKGKAFLDTIKRGEVPNISGFGTQYERVTTTSIKLNTDNGYDWYAYLTFGGTVSGNFGWELGLYLEYEKASDSFVEITFLYTEL